MLTHHRNPLSAFRVSAHHGDLHAELTTPYDHYVYQDLSTFGVGTGLYENISHPYNLIGDLGRHVDYVEEVKSQKYIGLPPFVEGSKRLEGLRGWSSFVARLASPLSRGIENPQAFDKPVTHYNVVGLTSDKMVKPLFRSPLDELYEDPLPPVTGFTLVRGPEIVQNGNPLGVSTPIGCMTGLMPSHLSYHIPTDGYLGNNLWRFTSRFSYSSEDLFTNSFEYVVELLRTAINDEYTARSVYHIRYEFFFFLRYPGYPEYDSEEVLNNYVRYYAQIRLRQVLHDQVWHFTQPDPGWSVGTTYWGSTPVVASTWTYPYFSHPVCLPDRFDTCVGSSDGRSYFFTSDVCFNSFIGTVRSVREDCYATAFFSSKDAIDKHFERMKSNHIEALAEIGDIVRLVDLAVCLYQLRKRPKATIRQLLDLLSSVNLTYSLGIAPTISDAKDIARRSASFQRKYFGDLSASLYSPNTIYGKYELEMPDEFCLNFKGMTLVTRSKLRVRMLEDSLLASLMPVRSLGLLPSLSALWDLIPFSFVVDWLIPIGDSAEAVEMQAIMMALECQLSHHSIKLDYNFTEEVLADYNFAVLPGEGPDSLNGYRYFERFNLNSLPALGPTRLPVFGQASIPDWDLAGSLVYQLVK